MNENSLKVNSQKGKTEVLIISGSSRYTQRDIRITTIRAELLVTSLLGEIERNRLRW